MGLKNLPRIRFFFTTVINTPHYLVTAKDVIIAKNEIVEKPGSLFTVDEQDYDCDENASINKHK